MSSELAVSGRQASSELANVPTTRRQASSEVVNGANEFIAGGFGKKVACSPFLIYNQTLQSAESPVFGLFLLL